MKLTLELIQKNAGKTIEMFVLKGRIRNYYKVEIEKKDYNSQLLPDYHAFFEKMFTNYLDCVPSKGTVKLYVEKTYFEKWISDGQVLLDAGKWPAVRVPYSKFQVVAIY
jgi:hypothetical protein